MSGYIKMFGSVGTVLIGAVLILFYILNKRIYTYWKRRGVVQVTPLPIVGNMLEVIFLRKTLGQFYEDIYTAYKDRRIIGFYELVTPCLLVTDPALVAKIFVKDFSHFVNRDIPQLNKDKSEVDSGMPQLKDSEWRGVRYKFLPAFSSGKLKLMYPYMRNCADSILEYLESQPKTDVDIMELTTKYALDAIATCAFGIDIRQDVNKNSQFRSMGKKILNLETFQYYCFLLINMNSKVAEKLGLTLTSGKVGRFFAKMIKDTIRLREETKVKRNDFIDLMIQIRDKGVIEVPQKDPDDNYLKLDFEPTTEIFHITEPMLISQAFTFLTAGFDGLSGPMACILYELAKQPDLQTYIRQEVKDQVMKYGDLNYEALKSSKYLDCCINEGLRIYPLTKFLSRVCNKEYEIEPGVKIQVGTKVVISNSGLQLDSNYFPDPLKFDPTRFETEITHTVTDFTNLPFGAGPRMCIGMRFAQLIMKMGLATILTNYEVELASNAPKKLTMKIKTFFINQPADIIKLNLKKIK